MKYQIDILQVASGEIRTLESEFESDDIPSWMYSEGNYSCDCNRAIFFNRVNGIELEVECSDNLYKVKVYNLDTSKEIIKEFP